MSLRKEGRTYEEDREVDPERGFTDPADVLIPVARSMAMTMTMMIVVAVMAVTVVL